MWYGFRWRTSNSKLPLPPGPRKLPLVGNLFSMPSSFEWKTYLTWSRRYGPDIIHLDVAGTSMIVLSSWEATVTLLDKRSSIYSDRSSRPMLLDLMGWGDKCLLNLRRTHRRLFSQGFNSTSSHSFRPTEITATHNLLHQTVRRPDEFMEHLKHMVGEIIVSVAYGIDILPTNDPFISLSEEAGKVIHAAGLPGQFLVDWVPLLKYVPDWFPGAGFKRLAQKSRNLLHALNEVPFAETKWQVAAGTAPRSFTSESLQLLCESDDVYYQEDTIKAIAASMYSAGFDTTGTALATSVQETAQMEIDRVVGQKRLPEFDDESSLQYVSALVKEVLRWQMVTSFGTLELSHTWIRKKLDK
ncbi:cytochrome P450 [Mycena crocata]|nr:cytochrome P450 [Mycena crocata]